MAWFDILGGLAKGASQGLGDLRQDLQQRKENELRVNADKRAQQQLVLQQQEEARAAKAARDREILEQASRMDPANVDPEWVSTLGPEAKFWVNKTPNGFVLKEEPLKVLQRQNATAVAQDAPAALEAAQLGRQLQTTDTRTKLAAQETWASPRFASLPDNAKIAVGMAAGKDGNEIMATLKNPSVWMNRQPGLAAVNAQVAGSREAAATAFKRYAAQNATDIQVAKIRAEQAGSEAQRVEFMRLVSSIMNNEEVPAEEAVKRAQALLALPTAPAPSVSRFKIEPE